MLNKKLYKNISVVALGAALISLPLFTACESDVVDLSPVDKFSDLTAYGTPERCELSMIGAYDAAQCGMYIPLMVGNVVILSELQVYNKVK